jgi:hypothetical protein
MERTGPQPGHPRLAQPPANRSLGNRDREPPFYLVTQIDAAPTDHFVFLRIEARERQRLQLRHLHIRQGSRMIAGPNRSQAGHTFDIVAMDPVSRSLTVHPRLRRRLVPRFSVQDHRKGHSRRTRAASLLFAAILRSAAAV